jgi:hypothetical protein
VNDDRYHDELAYGADAEPSGTLTRPRAWLLVTLAGALLGGLGGWRAGSRDSTLDAAAAPTRSPGATGPVAATTPPGSVTPSSSATTRPTRAPAGLVGEVFRGGVRGELVVGGVRLLVVSLPGGQPRRVTGMPDDCCVHGLVRVDGATLVLLGDFDHVNPTPARLYSLADGTTVARRIAGTGHELAPGATARTFWLFSQQGRRMHAEERDLTGRVLHKVVVPGTPVRGVMGGLLLRDAGVTGGSPYGGVWDPDRRKVVRRFAPRHLIYAATGTHVVLGDSEQCDAAMDGGCTLHVTDLRDGADVLISLPRGYAQPSAELSPDGSHIVVVARRTDDFEIADSFLVTVGNGVVRRVSGGSYPPSTTAELEWTDDGHVVFGVASSHQLQLAVLLRRGSLALLPRDYPWANRIVVRPSS